MGKIGGLSEAAYARDGKNARQVDEYAAKPAFMAPELLPVVKNVFTSKSDVFSFGMLLWTLVPQNKGRERDLNVTTIAALHASIAAGTRLRLPDAYKDGSM